MTERRRDPPPLLTRRMPSGRGAMEQPNNTSEVARLTVRFWVALLGVALATGVLGALTMAVLHVTQHLAFGYRAGSFGGAVARATGQRRVLALAVGGALVGPAWFALRRGTSGSSDADDAVWSGTAELGAGRSLGTALLSEIAVGAGASLGREAAPKLLGALSGSVLGRWAQLSSGQRRLLVACGAGAGLGAVYNVPLGGALLTAELLVGQLSLPVLLPALLSSVLATVVATSMLSSAVTYPGVPTLSAHAPQVVYAVVSGPLVGLLAVVLVRGVGWVSHHQLRGRRVIAGPFLAFSALGLLALPYPLLLGNGKDLTREAFLGRPHALVVLVALVLLKPAVTLLCLGSGASGGLLTPVLSTGATLGLLLGELWQGLWPGGPLAAYAVITGAALLGAATQAPLTALVLVLELTGNTVPVAVPMILATTLATAVARQLDGYSVYTARLQPAQTPSAPGRAAEAG